MSHNRTTVKTLVRRRDGYRLLLIGALIGVCSGLVVVGYRFVLVWAEHMRDAAFVWADSIPRLALLFVGLVLLGLLTGFITRSEPLIRGSGIPQVEAQLQGYFSPRWLPVLLKKFSGGALAILGGLSLGREGPSVQLGAMAAQGVCQSLGCSRVEEKYLLTCGACAGLAAAFNAPLSGVMFALEEVHKNFSSRAIFSAMLAAIVADVTAKLFFGVKATLGIAPVELLPIQYYLLYLGMGLLLGAFGALYNYTLFATQRLYARFPLPDWLRVVVPFVLAGVVGQFMPQALGSGHGVIDALAQGDYGLRFMLILLVVKLAFSHLSFGSGAPGGIFFPLLVLGALGGGIYGELAVRLFGLPQADVINFTLMGMAGMFSAVVRAPLTGILLVVEMSGSLTQLLGLAIVACFAWLSADLLRSRPVYAQMLDNMTSNSDLAERGTHEQTTLDLTVSYRSPLAGRRVSDVQWPESSLVVSVCRGDLLITPHGETRIEAGDVVTVLCRIGDEALIRSAVKGE